MSGAFFDTNILIYATLAADPRRPVARALLDHGGSIGTQCLNEFASVVRRKLRVDWAVIREQLAIIAGLCSTIVPLDVEVHRSGLDIAERHLLSVYDGMIVAAALAADCDTLYSEDMHAGLVIADRLTIVNPFA